MRSSRQTALLTDPGPIDFTAVIQKDDDPGSGSYVSVPFDLKATYGKGNLVPVNALFDGRVSYTGSLANMGGSSAVLGLRKDKLAALGKSAGDSLHVRIELDAAPRVVALPSDLVSALSAAPAAETLMERISVSSRRDFVRWIESAKTPTTRQRRIDQTVATLASGKRSRRS